MSTPQITLIVMLSLWLGIHLAKHGQVKANARYHFGWALADVALWVTILTWGGFWK